MGCMAVEAGVALGTKGPDGAVRMRFIADDEARSWQVELDGPVLSAPVADDRGAFLYACTAKRLYRFAVGGASDGTLFTTGTGSISWYVAAEPEFEQVTFVFEPDEDDGTPAPVLRNGRAVGGVTVASFQPRVSASIACNKSWSP